MPIEEAVHLLTAGKVATVDVGDFIAEDRRSDFFMHAAAIGLSLDGEVSAQIPGDFVVAADALRVITPQHFVVDD